MNQNGMIAIIGTLGAMILVASGIRARRLPAKQFLGMALIWIGIIGLVWGAVVLAQRYLLDFA